MLTKQQKAAVISSFKLVVPIADTAAELFYKRLFELAPHYRSLFKGDMASQRRKLVAMLAFVVKAMDWQEDQWQQDVGTEEDLFLVVLALGRRHVDLYKVPDESYDVVGEALLWALDYGLGEAFTAEVRDAWARVYWVLSKTMKMGRCAVGDGSVVALRAKHA